MHRPAYHIMLFPGRRRPCHAPSRRLLSTQELYYLQDKVLFCGSPQQDQGGFSRIDSNCKSLFRGDLFHLFPDYISPSDALHLLAPAQPLFEQGASFHFLNCIKRFQSISIATDKQA
jgi:hypothetical protein